MHEKYQSASKAEFTYIENENSPIMWNLFNATRDCVFWSLDWTLSGKATFATPAKRGEVPTIGVQRRKR